MAHVPSQEALDAVTKILKDEQEVDARLLRSMVCLVGNDDVRTQLERRSNGEQLKKDEEKTLDAMSNLKPSSIYLLENLSHEIASNYGSLLDDYIPINE